MMKPSSIGNFYSQIPARCLTRTREPRKVLVRNFTSSEKPVHHTEDVLADWNGRCKRVILNRPKALNSLNLPMVRKLTHYYKQWQDDYLNVVIMKGIGDKAFCAGGDIRAIYDAGISGQGSITRDFFAEEYKLNWLISTQKFWHIAILNGITMGGGVGLSVHGKYRIATEETTFAMPETSIGFFPDVGGSFFLPRLPIPGMGMYLGLTGARLKGPDVRRVGVASHYVPSSDLLAVEEKLFRPITYSQELVETLKKYELPPNDPPSEVLPYTDVIEQAFHNSKSVEEIISVLRNLSTSSDAKIAAWAKTTLASLEKASPTSLKVTFRQLKEGSKLSYDECFKMEFRISQAFMKGKDFFEGVRAALVDKDKKPKWSPATLEEVSDSDVAKYFEKLSPELELELKV